MVMPPATGGCPTVILDARNYSTTGVHAGSSADPWPGLAIKNALDALPGILQPGCTGTVFVSDGIWLIDSLLQVDGVNNFILEGESTAAELRFTSSASVNHQIWMGGGGSSFGGFTNGRFTGLTFNANGLSSFSAFAALRLTNANNMIFENNIVLGHGNGAVPATFTEGGTNNIYRFNTFIGGSNGGDNTLQIQPGNTGVPKTGFTITNNTFTDTGPVGIGISNCEISYNTLTNPDTGGFIAILFCGGTSTSDICTNVTLDHNTVNAGGANGAYVGGIPNDSPLGSYITNFRITNNTITGTQATLACQSFDGNNYYDGSLIGSEKRNVTITGNVLTSNNPGLPAVINVMGGTSTGIGAGSTGGIVDTVEVTSNTLINTGSTVTLIQTDVNTLNSTIHNNIGYP